MSMKIVSFKQDPKQSKFDQLFSIQEAKSVKAFHESLPNYKATPLQELKRLSSELGVKGIYVKDESYRFGLNAFKGLGGSYALAKVIANTLNISLDDVQQVKPNTFTFVTATDGNHGRGVAWAAQNLQQKAVVYMPKGSAQERLDNIRKLGATAEITDLNYDDTVRFAKEQADINGWTLVQDTAWPGYEEIPAWIMQGYMTLALEAVEALGDVKPTHIFLQAGVGAMAGALTGFFHDIYQTELPVITYVEPNQADCLFKTAEANDGKLHAVEGDLDSIMAGLCCGEVCTVGWEQIRQHGSHFVSCPDFIAADGMRVLGNPLPGDTPIISGESGAVTTGLVYNLLTKPEFITYKEQIGLSDNSVILCISTEGDTDKENYRRVVWEGAYPKQ
ncbi:diaminopropionate ammonia-lyase [Veillonella sp. R32]|uniref:diaminopropionate ammonia-lyase n=1 Tax=Veillonella sp. R32 TaxID=2021312 RepID=UPI001389AD63|nr:diaminopropionate ammonia-lyase [Veillonella sp. R32]KAF1678954.1 diaminopropionate ammonia-lyase [Veillonella sp. R32]